MQSSNHGMKQLAWVAPVKLPFPVWALPDVLPVTARASGPMIWFEDRVVNKHYSQSAGCEAGPFFPRLQVIYVLGTSPLSGTSGLAGCQVS